jgi:hypothetical protein
MNFAPTLKKLSCSRAERQLEVGADRVEILVDLLAALADAAQREGGRIEQRRDPGN